jgi:uncharacterized membrane protein
MRDVGAAIRWQRELPHWLLIWAMFALAAFTWDAAPDFLPVHWNLAGEADRFSGKVEGLLALPVIALVMYLVLLVAPMLMSARPEQLGGVYTGVRFAVLLMLAALYVLILLSIRGVPIDMTRAATMLVGALLIGVGAVMGRMRPNAVMGVRTPWTLASQASWDASQRLGGWLFIAVGALLTLGGLLGVQWLMVAGIVVLFLCTPVLIWYGYWIARSDPRRLPKGQTLLTAREQGIGDKGQGTGAGRREQRAGRRQGGRRGRGGRRR